MKSEEDQKTIQQEAEAADSKSEELNEKELAQVAGGMGKKQENPDELWFESLNGDSCGEKSFLPVRKVLADRIHIEPFGGRPSDTSAFPFFEFLSCRFYAFPLKD